MNISEASSIPYVSGYFPLKASGRVDLSGVGIHKGAGTENTSCNEVS